jgi:hypothetical protein
MENIKKVNVLKPNSKPTSDEVEKIPTSTLFANIKAMDIPPRDIGNVALYKFMTEMYEKLEGERNTLKEKNEKILKENSNLKVLEATLKEKIKVLFVKDFFNIIIGISATTFFTVSDKVFPKNISAIAFIVSLLIYFILTCSLFKKD